MANMQTRKVFIIIILKKLFQNTEKLRITSRCGLKKKESQDEIDRFLTM